MDKKAPKSGKSAPESPVEAQTPVLRVALFQEVPGDSGEVRFRYRGHGKAMLPFLVVFLISVGMVIMPFKAASLGRINHLLAGVLMIAFGLLALMLLLFFLLQIWTHQRMTIDPAEGRLKITVRTPFSRRVEDHSMENMVSVLVCPPVDGAEHHQVQIEMGDGTFVDLGRGPRPEAVTVGRRIAFLINRPFRLS